MKTQNGQRYLGLAAVTALLAITPWIVPLAYGADPPPAPLPQAAKEMQTSTPAGKAYSPKERQTYQKKVAADLDQLQQEINGLVTNEESVAPQVKRTRMRATLGLRKQVVDARKQLAALEQASDQDWGGLKTKMDKSLETLTKAYQETEASLR